jgi:prenylcysteine oxidase/farnesylcysteine lyase
MARLSMLLLGLSLLFNEASAASLKVAVVGAGAGGSSAAYWLSLAKQRAATGTNVTVTVYEQNNYVGGRRCIPLLQTESYLKFLQLREHYHLSV